MFGNLILYFLEIARYFLGNKIFFQKPLKRFWVILVMEGIHEGVLFCFLYERNLADKDLTVYLFVAAAFFIMLEGETVKKIFQIISFFCIFACMDETVGIGISWILGRENFTYMQMYLMECAVVNLVLLALYFLKKAGGRQGGQADGEVSERGYIVILFAGISLALLVSSIVLFQGAAGGKGKTIYDILGAAAYVCIIGMILFLFYVRRVNEQGKRLFKTQQVLNEMQKDYYQALLEKERETKQYRHDMNSHLMYLYELVRGNDKAEKYIQELQGNLVGIKTKCFLTGNDMLDTILNYYLSGYENGSVSVIGKLREPPDISDVDFCIIISNLIKNAIEDIEREDLEEKYIRVSMKPGKNHVLIEIKNASCLCIEKGDLNMKTRKRDRKNHGLGLINVRETVKKNGGTFELTGDGKEVTARVTLRIKTEPFTEL